MAIDRSIYTKDFTENVVTAKTVQDIDNAIAKIDIIIAQKNTDITSLNTDKASLQAEKTSIESDLPTIQESSLPDGTNTVAYSETLTVVGGTSTFTWAIISGVLPSGLSISAGGVISGTPDTIETSTFEVQVTDSSTPDVITHSVSLSITVN